MIPDNACILRITAAAGTELADAYSLSNVRTSSLTKEVYNPMGFLIPSRGIALSGFRPLQKIPHCCLPQESGPCLSSSVSDRPLKPDTDRRLGRLLLYQQANQPQASL